jgi:pyruvate,water dikinase
MTLGTIPAFLFRGFDKALGTLGAASKAEPDAHAVTGMAASPGRATGPVRVIRRVEEFDRLQPGDVLVSPATTPAWTPLFQRAVAVVTDVGSLVAHASLVAREYGIPAVVGTGDATARLRDGQVVTVDGARGIVYVER